MRHPAKFTNSILERAYERLDVERFVMLQSEPRVLDPFAGTGKGVDALWREGFDTVGVELEPEWAAESMTGRVIVGNALALPFEDQSFDAIFTSPTYGNRMADHHVARDACKPCEGTGIDAESYVPATHLTPSEASPCRKCDGSGLSRRNTYTHALGRKLTEDNSGAMQWGPQYRTFHSRAWEEAWRVIRPGGVLLLNMKDHVRHGQRQRVTEWHADTLHAIGFDHEASDLVYTPGNRQGANGAVRIPFEYLLTFRKAHA